MPDDGIPLDRWANFYLITSTAAATLIGLLFAVITLAAERRPKDLAKIRLYLTPTVVYFASVLCLAALLTFPNQTRVSVALCNEILGGLGIVYSASMLFGRGKRKPEYDDPSDVVQYVLFPVVAYGLLVAGGLVLGGDVRLGLTLVAIGMLALIALALRNSWAIAVDLVKSPRRQD
jgi:hypothetical protein